MSENLQESIKWHNRGGIILLILLAISLAITWSGLAGIPDNGLLGASVISLSVFGGIGCACLIKARSLSKLLGSQV